MKTKCQFCDYQKDTPLSLDILKIIAEKDLPVEDYLLWVQRLVKQHGLKDYNSVKIHMGIKHKEATSKGLMPLHDFVAEERVIINA